MGNKIVKQILKDQSLAASFFSEAIPVGPFVDNLMFNIEAKDVIVNTGVFTIEHRIVKDEFRKSAWGPLCLDEDPTLTNESTVKTIYLNQAPIGEVRIVFTVEGISDGNCDIWYSGRNL
jgi:hypothetical protein